MRLGGAVSAEDNFVKPIMSMIDIIDIIIAAFSLLDPTSHRRILILEPHLAAQD